MSRRDLYHEIFKTALEADNWIITDDPLDLTVGGVELYADVGAEKVIAASIYTKIYHTKPIEHNRF